MNDPSIGLQFGAIIFLVILSAYFSGSETAMMALNRYRLKHMVNEGSRSARLANDLLEKPDKLLSIILIGNNLVNFSAASLATLIALEVFGEAGIALAPVICTLVFLVFAEVAPKTVAAMYPEKIALPSSYILKALLIMGQPLVWMVNGLAKVFLFLIGIKPQKNTEDELSPEELRTVVYEGSSIHAHPQNMLLGILDLNRVTVEDIMIPRNEIFGIDIEDDLEDIVSQIKSSQHTRVPVFKEDIDKVIGILHMRSAAKFMSLPELTKAAILQETAEPYFVPENTSLQLQLLNFQQMKERNALVVDEYGDIQGMITIEDILEEIVGEFTTDVSDTSIDIHPQEDGSYLIDGSTHVRLINRSLGWELPQEGAKTLSGVVTEYLEAIPDSNICVAIGPYRIEVVQIKDNMIKTA
ncbi:MAG: HlyC/CorC family transporter, partial [Gammaproteobacteria bacterium]|nr:HlyC/CorC family transporter [Gammaproteobacteria bacterium]